MQNPRPYTSPYELVAQISKTRGLEGELVAQELGELPVLCPGLEVWVVPPVLEGVRHTAVTLAQDDFKKRGVLIRLEGVESRTQASRLTGRYLLACTQQAELAARRNSLAYGEAFPETFDEALAGEPARGQGSEPHGKPGGASAWAPDGISQDEISRDEVPAQLRTQRAAMPLGTTFTDTAYGSLGRLDAIKTGPAYAIWVVLGPYGRLEIPAVDAYIVEEAPEQVVLSLPRGFIEITTGGERVAE